AVPARRRRPPARQAFGRRPARRGGGVRDPGGARRASGARRRRGGRAMSVRPIVLQATASAAVAGLAWHLLLLPMQTRAAAARAEQQRRTELVARYEGSGSAAESAAQLETLRRGADDLRPFWSRSGDASGLYDAFRQAAVGAGVSIDRIEPRRGGLAAARGKSNADIRVIGYSLEITGDFGEIAAFMDTLH